MLWLVIKGAKPQVPDPLGEAGADAFTIRRLAGHSSVTVKSTVHSSHAGVHGAGL
jgi:hypothetical protein